MNLPNKLTVSRFVLTAAFLWAMFSRSPVNDTLALVFFSLAGITDYLDGKIARQRKLITNFGGSILRGEGDFYQKNVFLEGDRYDKNSTIIEVRSEPFRQFTVTVNYSMLSIKDHTVNKVYSDDLMTVTAELDF